MHTSLNSRRLGIRRQAGFSLMEAVVAMSISLVVTASMVALMANSLGTTSRIVNMTKLSDDLRSTMQLLTRDVRRASYNANAMLCYGNDDCYTDGSLTMSGDVVISNTEDCFTFQLDRLSDGDSTNDEAGGFRRVETGGVGALEMWTGGNAPDCAAESGGDWVQVTNPDSMDITGFNVNDDDLSYTEVIFDDGVTTISQRVRKLRFQVDAQLVNAEGITRHVEDVISVRNDLLL
ncbi:MAG TPA: prepilin-type N-terminal cleavage/methylation domain-containing protein [Xanthomonadales bacterium]|nr:prepilin-type N-terminal cleavage/methylation domain-containing protein [Xanthomonadales bacterium]